MFISSPFYSQQSFKTDWEKEMGSLRSQSQNYQRIMPIVRGRDNHPRCGKLRTKVLLFLLQAFKFTYPVRMPWPLYYTGVFCELCCLFCWFWSFLITLLQYSPESESNSFSIRRWSLSHAVYQGLCKVCFDKWIWVCSISEKEEVRNCSEGCSSIDQPPAFLIILLARWILTSCS